MKISNAVILSKRTVTSRRCLLALREIGVASGDDDVYWHWNFSVPVGLCSPGQTLMVLSTWITTPTSCLNHGFVECFISIMTVSIMTLMNWSLFFLDISLFYPFAVKFEIPSCHSEEGRHAAIGYKRTVTFLHKVFVFYFSKRINLSISRRLLAKLTFAVLTIEMVAVLCRWSWRKLAKTPNTVTLVPYQPQERFTSTNLIASMKM